MKTFLKVLLVLVLIPLVLVAALVAYFLATEHQPEPVEAVAVECQGEAPGLKAGEEFTLLNWNLQYGASRKHRFFYDGGEAVHVPPEDVAWTVEAIQGVLAATKAEVVVLQEVDRNSTRTGRIDQLPPFVRAAAATCKAATTYHQSPFVPSPTHQPLGRVDMQLATLVQGPMLHASRIALPLLAEARYRQVFNLKRALLVTEVPVQGWDKPLAIANTHLSAFSYGDGTHEQQVAVLKKWIEDRPADQPWILAGDMNLLPPGFDKNSLAVESDLYADQKNPIDLLLPAQKEALGDQLAPENRTYLPFGHDVADRKIDYVFYGGPIQVRSARVMSEHAAISDHLPVLATLVIGAPPVEEPAAVEVPGPVVVPGPQAKDIMEKLERLEKLTRDPPG
jgi:endonuclease/exonuclease/phosphatase family metal-dependent hydrolase